MMPQDYVNPGDRGAVYREITSGLSLADERRSELHDVAVSLYQERYSGEITHLDVVTRAIEASINIVLAILFFLATAVKSEENNVPSIAAFLENVKAAVETGGKVELERFECDMARSSGIVDCYDSESGIGFQYKSESFGQVINVNIVLHTPSDNRYDDHLPIYDDVGFSQQRAEFLAVPERDNLPRLGECGVELSSGSSDSESVAHFTWENPATGTLMLIVFNGSAARVSIDAGRPIPEQNGYLVGSVVIVNRLDALCEVIH
ncbi:MAG: hypothetical protein JNK19_04635 [Tabrizicola sp.]|nr:hypothetical protein [Tabrizicola sp.]